MLSTGAISGIIVAGVVVVAAIAFACILSVICFVRWLRNDYFGLKPDPIKTIDPKDPNGRKKSWVEPDLRAYSGAPKRTIQKDEGAERLRKERYYPARAKSFATKKKIATVKK